MGYPPELLSRAIAVRQVFDDPHRSDRNRTITHAFAVQLQPTSHPPALRAGDDAEEARWVPLGEVRREGMYEDHYDILMRMVDKLP